MSVTIRTAALEDLFNLSMLFSKYLQHHDQKSYLADCILFMEKRLSLFDSQIFVVEQTAEKKIVGFAQLYPVINSYALKKVWNLSDVYIDTNVRRMGYGRQLLKECERFTHDSGSDGLTLKLDQENPVAAALYESLGWKKEGESTYILDQNSRNEYTVMLPF